MSYEVDLANELFKRNNIKINEAVRGEVLSVSPLRIGIMQNKVVLENDWIYICSRVAQDILNFNIQLNSVADHGDIETNGTIQIKDLFKKGDYLMCIPTENGRKYFVVDKVVN